MIMASSHDLQEIRRWISSLFANDVHVEGLFRRNGNVMVIDYHRYEDFGPHEKGAMVKRQLNHIRNRLINRSLTSRLIEFCSSKGGDQETMENIHGTIAIELPTSYVQLLGYLFALLREVASNEETTKMGVGNLGVCIGPSIFSLTVEQLRCGSHLPLFALMMRHPQETIPNFDGAVESLTAEALLMVSKKEHRRRYLPLVEEEEDHPVLVDHSVATTYKNCIDEMQNNVCYKEDWQLITIWEREEESDSKSEVTTDEKSHGSEESQREESPVSQEEGSREERQEDPSSMFDEFTSDPLEAIDRIMRFSKKAAQFEDWRTSKAAFILQKNRFGETAAKRRETEVWYKTSVKDRMGFFNA